MIRTPRPAGIARLLTETALADLYEMSRNLGSAVTALVVGRGRIRERMLTACETGLWALNPSLFTDPSAQARAAELLGALFNDRETTAAILEAMPEERVAELAHLVIELDTCADLQIRSRRFAAH